MIGSSLHLAGPSQALDEIVVGQRQTADGSHISEAEITVDGVSMGRYPLSAGETAIPLGVPAAQELTLTVTQVSNPAAEEPVGITELEVGAWSLELDPLHEAVGRCVPIGSLDDAPLEAAVAEPIGDDGTFTLAARGGGRLQLGAGERCTDRRAVAAGSPLSARRRRRSDTSSRFSSRGSSDQLVATLAHGRGQWSPRAVHAGSGRGGRAGPGRPVSTASSSGWHRR